MVLIVSLIPCAVALPSFSGTVEDNLKAQMDGAKITLWDAASGKGLATSSSMGHFSFSGVSEGDYLFRVERDGMVPVYGALHLAGDGPHEIGVVMLPITRQNIEFIGAGSPLRASFRPPPTSAKPPKVKPAQVTKRVAPVYPDSAKKAGINGTVKIATIILPDGTLDDMVVLSAPDASLALAALLAVRQWRYSPTSLDGQAVEASLTIDVNFER